jgi:hypothetical protein
MLKALLLLRILRLLRRKRRCDTAMLQRAVLLLLYALKAYRVKSRLLTLIDLHTIN